MKYLIADQSGEVLAEDIAENRIEEILRSKSRGSSFIVAAQLPTSFYARVLRNSGMPEIVEIKSNGKTISLLRETSSQKGDIGVSCSSDGDSAMVNTINIKFRGYDDDFTDRGIVWVYPGDPASIQLVIRREALETLGKVQEIIKEAKSVLADKLLDRLDLATI